MSKRKYKQGIYRPKFPEKYKGSLPIYYRSQWECKACGFFDHNPAVISWGSESVVIPYPNPLTGRVSRYFVDFDVVMKDKQGNIKKLLVEVKPYVQTLPPVQTKNTKSLMKRQAEYIKNQAKWKSAREYADKRGYTFTLITEKQLFAS